MEKSNHKKKYKTQASKTKTFIPSNDKNANYGKNSG
jgi:hypothetical protein